MSVLTVFPSKWSGMQREWDMVKEMIDAIPSPSPTPSGGGFFTDGGGTDAAIGKGVVAPTAAGDNALAQGDSSQASGNNAFALGDTAVASGAHSFAQGYSVTASGNHALAQGYGATASGLRSFAQGYNCTATYPDTFAQGYADATADSAFAQGNAAVASGAHSFAQGNNVSTSSPHSMVQGSGVRTYFGDTNFAQGYSISVGTPFPGAIPYRAFAQGSTITVAGYDNFAHGYTIAMAPTSGSNLFNGNTISGYGYNYNSIVNGYQQRLYANSSNCLLVGNFGYINSYSNNSSTVSYTHLTLPTN